ncbi:MAG TPA: hypothetical protein GXX36_13765 [Clostridiaceae bacterium]|nr:hypothetical protein [Clostridiaceae bacterium]
MYEIIENTKQFHDGMWVLVRIDENSDLIDLYVLMKCKKQPVIK